MDRIDKSLRRFSPKERKTALTMLQRIREDKLADFDIKKLRGYADIFRAKAGVVRVIYQRNEKGINILSLSRRDEKTYRDF